MMPRLPVVLGLLWLALAAAAAAPWLLAPSAWLGPAPAPGGAAAAPALPATPAMQTFAALVERPLFTASRRPPPVAAAPAAGDLLLGRYRLSGVVVTPTRRIVLLREADSGKTLSVAQGERVGDWLVADVTRARIVLETATDRRVIRLDAEKGG